MAAYAKTRLTQNNLERRYQSTSMFLQGKVSDEYALRDSQTGLPTPAKTLETGDLVAIGKFPANSLIMNCRILVHEAFATDTTLNLYVQADFPGVGAIPVNRVSDIVVDSANHTINVQLTLSGNRDETGVLPTDGDGTIWVGDNNGFFVVAELGGADVDANDPKGIVEVVFDYTNFGTNTGSYTGGQ